MSEFVIITGLSGAGRSTAANVLEDMGWFVIDNLPPVLIEQMAELVQRPGSDTSRVVFAVGTGAYFAELAPAIEKLRATSEEKVRIVFLDAADDVLVRRFEGNRRRHALQEHGLAEAVRQERELLGEVKGMADVVIDTSDLNVHQLRDRIGELFTTDDASNMRTSVMSFGYKHGLPLDVDIVLDCRFLPNPHWDEKLRPLTGLDAPVRDFVMTQPETSEFLKRLDDLLELLMPAYVNEGKSYLTIAVGCTGGRHRSVALAEEIASRINAHGYEPAVSHRDITK